MAGGKGEGGRDGGEEGEKKGFGGGRWLSSPPAGRALSSSRFSRFIFFSSLLNFQHLGMVGRRKQGRAFGGSSEQRNTLREEDS